MSNEQAFIKYIEEQGVKELNTAWIIWMLEELEDCRIRNIDIDPYWLRATLKDSLYNEPPMTLQ